MLGQMKTESRIGDSKFGVTAVDGIAGETRAIAKVLAIRSAINALAIRPAEPWNAYAVADLEFRMCFLADLFHSPDNLVSKNQWQLRVRQFPVHHVKISAANSAGVDAY